MKQLAKRVQALEKELAACNRCGTCHSVCPLFAETWHEADVARGKLALLSGLAKQIFENPKGVIDRLDHCLLCGSCADNCPADVPTLEIFLKARTVFTEFRGLSTAQKIILRGMLSRPSLLDRLFEWGAVLQSCFLKPKNKKAQTSCARIFSPLLRQRHVTPLAERPLHRRIKDLNLPAVGSGMKVAFFIGCLIDKLLPRVGEAVLDVLNHHRVGVVVPDNQGCCGIPSLSAGDLDSFNRLVTHNLDILTAHEFDFLVTACPTCTYTIHQLWPLFATTESGRRKAQIHSLAEKTIDIGQFVARHFVADPAHVSISSDAKSIVYHDPCHLKKSLKVSAEPRALINLNPAYRLLEMPESDSCCGLGGSFNFKYYKTSIDIGRQKLEKIESIDCSAVATGCPACMTQLADLLSRAGKEIAVKHFIEIYAETCHNRLHKQYGKNR